MNKKVVFSSPQPYNRESIIESPELQELQEYMPIDSKDLSVLREDIKNNGIRDPLKVCMDKDHNTLLLGGMNRLTIAKELGIETVPVIFGHIEGDEFSPLSTKQRQDIVWQDNLSRRHLTVNQKVNLIDYLLENNPTASSRSIAHILGVSHHTVEKQRQVSSGQNAQSERTGIDGRITKTQAGKKKKPIDKKSLGKVSSGQNAQSERTAQKTSIDAEFTPDNNQFIKKSEILKLIESYKSDIKQMRLKKREKEKYQIEIQVYSRVILNLTELLEGKQRGHIMNLLKDNW